MSGKLITRIPVFSAYYDTATVLLKRMFLDKTRCRAGSLQFANPPGFATLL